MNVYKEDRWKIHRSFRMRPAHFFLSYGDSEWDKALCGYFAYHDKLEPTNWTNNPFVRCSKCDKIINKIIPLPRLVV
jgi:hypothetical protein